MTISRRLLAVAALAAAFVAGLSAPAFAQTPVDYTSPSQPVSDHLTLGGCVVRFDTLSASGASIVPRIHANGTHHCVGVKSVRADWSTGPTRGDLVVEFDGTGPAVVTTLVGNDESFPQRQVFCGASGGVGGERVRCYRNGVKVPAFSKALYGPTMNLWLIFVSWTP